MSDLQGGREARELLPLELHPTFVGANVLETEDQTTAEKKWAHKRKFIMQQRLTYRINTVARQADTTTRWTLDSACVAAQVARGNWASPVATGRNRVVAYQVNNALHVPV